MIKAVVMLAALAVMMIIPASAQFYGPAMASPTGGYAPGYVDSVTWSNGVGASTNTDSFLSGVSSPFWGLGTCGWPFGGLAPASFGGNLAAQNSAMGTYTRTTSFGLGQPVGLVFGIPVAAPSGLMFC